ncbi:MAG: YcbK family protein [Acidobacteriaceae bacterium]
MRIVSSGRAAALAATAALFLSSPTHSKAVDTNYPAALTTAPAAGASLSPSTPAEPTLALAGKPYRLRLHHLHTGETIDVVYRIGDTYLPAALDRLNHFLRDHRTEDVSSYDPREFDVLHSLMASLGRPEGVIDIVCGYRTPWSNNFLRTRSATTGVAEHSQHMLAKAIDIRVPGINTTTLRDAALALKAGGVGFYPVSQFVHVDVGPVRTWQYR